MALPSDPATVLPAGHKAVRLRIEGRVQGVGYRAWTLQQATTLGLSGWVRNHLDGTVEVLAVGPAHTVDTMIEACRQGPRAARVTAVSTEPAQGIVADGFREMPTV
jgi:acylphosphatase